MLYFNAILKVPVLNYYEEYTTTTTTTSKHKVGEQKYEPSKRMIFGFI